MNRIESGTFNLSIDRTEHHSIKTERLAGVIVLMAPILRPSKRSCDTPQAK
jgi:hypothetical protein